MIQATLKNCALIVIEKNSVICNHQLALRNEGGCTLAYHPQTDIAGVQVPSVPRTLFSQGCGRLLEVWA